MKVIIKIIFFNILLPLPMFSQQLDSLLPMLEANNPGLEAIRQDYASSQFTADQFSDLPDPQVSVGVFPLPVETRLGPQQWKVGITQMFPWNGVLENRAEVARRESELKNFESKIASEDLALLFKKLYIQAWQLRRQKEVIEERLPLLESRYDLTLRMAEHGKTSSSDIFQVQMLINEIENSIDVVEQQKVQIQNKLNKLLGRDLGDSISIVGDFSATVEDHLIESHTEDDLESVPDFMIFEQQRKVSEAKIERNKSERYPTLGLGIDYVAIGRRTDADPQHNGRDVIMPMVSASIPIFNKNYEAKDNQERAKLVSFDLYEENKRNEVNEIISSAKTEVLVQNKNYKFYAQQIEVIKRTLRVLEAQYSAEGNKFDELILYENKIIDYQLKQVNAIALSQIAKSEIERWISN
ncbi:TolC family protein [Membranihabitans maritimus]|uniref:TolC family protein n=1 Tax=Membranihabitans maritimus TaxID=2904244 RepID=UPI001EFFEF42|nr:TolC family protein [Membranihabitans maritimus]